MLPIKIRKKILNKLAQEAPASPASPTSPTAPNAPTEPASTTANSISPPPSFTASGAWGWMGNVYNSYSVSILDSLVGLLNTALHYSSEGKYNWQTLRNSSFNVDPSGASSVDTKNLLNLSKMVYQNYLNSGNAFPAKVTGNQVAAWNTALTQSQPFLNLSQLNPTGAVRQKIPGNIKENINNMLRDLARYNPQTPQQQR